jgi:hypothetical protein
LASIINSTDTGSGGLITTGDSSDELQLQTAETTALTITSGQQSAFIAGTAAAPAVTTTGDLNTGIYFPAADNIGFTTGGTIRGRWTTDGLCFGSDTAAANALDDYEEGTWTPSYSQGVTSPVYTNTGGFYKKVGALVFVSGNIQLSGGTGNASQILIAGLPFASGSGTGVGAAISVAYNGGFKTDGAFTMIIGGGFSVIDFYTFSGSSFSGSSATNVQALLTFSGCYQV